MVFLEQNCLAGIRKLKQEGQPGTSLTLLPKFQPSQQTIEYTCAPAAALMVVETF